MPSRFLTAVYLALLALLEVVLCGYSLGNPQGCEPDALARAHHGFTASPSLAGASGSNDQAVGPESPPLAGASGSIDLPGAARPEDDVFQAKVAPLLSQRCLPCHNGQKSRGGLNLTNLTAAQKGGDEGAAIVPGKPAESLLLQFVSGPEPRMPKQGARLTVEEVATLRRWIDAGAAWPKDLRLAQEKKSLVGPDWWALRPLQRPAIPKTRNQDWARTGIDSFLLAVLEQKGLSPSPPAERRTLIRRLHYDLHGLPPTPEEVAAFVADPRPDAYEGLVERLLASPRYGERWGRHWLDVVHYGDTHGYDKDKRRDNAWPYRDWVIRALNADMPYERFVRQQLAGDVLFPEDPGATVATGFIAAGPWDFVGHVELREGTVDKEKTRLLDRDDMLANAMSTFSSMTVHCARCHDHKFDPIPQRDYYQLQAVFAGVERGDRLYGGGPLRRERESLEKEKADLVARQESLKKAVKVSATPELLRLEEELRQRKSELAALASVGAPSPTNGYHSGIEAKPDVAKWVQVDLGQAVAIQEVRLIPARPTDFPDTPGFGFPPRFRVRAADDAGFAQAKDLLTHEDENYANPGDNAVSIMASNVSARFVRVDATRLWRRTNDFVFALAELQVIADGKNVAVGRPVTALDSIEAGRWSTRHLVDRFDSRRKLLDASDPGEGERLRRQEEARNRLAKLEQEIARMRQAILGAELLQELDKVPRGLALVDVRLRELPPGERVYAALPKPSRPIFVLNRGDVEQRGERVGPGALSCVAGLPSAFAVDSEAPEGARRAALANWIADPRNPLTWRSVVNRVWHYHFGRGLVETPNDFGWNGARPSHPELLDWLAADLLQSEGSLKRLHRLIVLSAAYRQSTAPNPAQEKIDADNRFLWRMNRQRLDAEALRDSILAISGKLDRRMGGPGFDLFRFKDDHSPVYDHSAVDKINDPAGFRRTVYRFVVRSVPNPFLECLDSADPNANTPVRNATLTALQALALLNDPFVVRQAEYFAERLERASPDKERQIATAYGLALGRPPRALELQALCAHAEKHGLASVCRLIFNMNEFVFLD